MASAVRTYRYYCVMERQGKEILLDGRADNKCSFLNSGYVKGFQKDGWTVTECKKREPETHSEKPWISFAFVDMGQATSE